MVRTEKLFSINWPVARGGYEWQPDINGEDRLRWDPSNCDWSPVEDTEHVRFANVTPDKEGILAYAKRRGDLWNRDGGATLDAWKDAIRVMKALTRFRHLIRDKRIEELKDVVKMVKGTDRGGRDFSAVRYGFQELGHNHHEITIADSRSPFYSKALAVCWDDYIASARLVLMREVNERLKIYTTVPQLTQTPDGKPVIDFVPDSLLGCLWLQLAQTITGRYRAEPCAGPGCTKIVRIGIADAGKRKAKGTQTVTCGTRCRQNFCRQQTRQAKEIIRAHPTMSTAKLYELLCAKGIAGGSWRGEDWVRRIRGSTSA